MSKRKKVASVMFTGAAATALVGAGIQPAAAAAQDWTISPGGSFSGENDTDAILTANGVQLVCPPTTVDATGSLKTSATGIPTELGAIATATFGTSADPCSLFGLGVVATLDDPIAINATAAPSGGTTPGNVGAGVNGETPGPINATIQGVGGFDCDMHVTGTSVPATYNNSGLFAINAANQQTLTIDSVSGCLGLFQPGDPAAFQADFTVDPLQTVTFTP